VPPHASGCEKAVGDYEQTTLDRNRPDVVVWMSTWETYDRIVDGQRVRFGGRAWDDMMLGEIDRAARRLTAGGAHLVIVTMAPRAPNELMTASAAAAETSRYVRLNALYKQYADAHSEMVSVVDFAAALCPGGPPCPHSVDCIDPRPLDGLHFTPETAEWAARWLLDAVLACRPATTAWLARRDRSPERGAKPSASSIARHD
jgi:hypothetical protein